MCPYSHLSKPFLLLSALSEAPQRVLKLSYISIQNKLWIKQAIPPGALPCHEAENFLTMPEASFNENLFCEETWTRGRMNPREPLNSRCTVCYRISRQDHWVLRSKMVQLPWPPLAKFIYSENSKSHFVVCKGQECGFFLTAQLKNTQVTASDGRYTYYQWLAPCRTPVKRAGNPPHYWENPCSHNLSWSAWIVPYPVCTVSWGSSGPETVSSKSYHVKVDVQVLLARAR